MVASASVGFLSSITPSGSPFTNSTTSGRRSILFSTTVNWLTASQALLGRIVEIDDSGLRAPNPPAVAVFHRHAVDDHAMERPVAGLQRRPFGVNQSPNGVAKRLTGQLWVEPRQRLQKVAASTTAP